MATLTIDDDRMTSDTTTHTAHAWPVPGEPTLWSVTWLPGRALTRDQAITAMTFAEMAVERAHILADRHAKLWWHMEGWAEELGLPVNQAMAMAMAPHVQQAEELGFVPAGGWAWMNGSSDGG